MGGLGGGNFCKTSAELLHSLSPPANSRACYLQAFRSITPIPLQLFSFFLSFVFYSLSVTEILKLIISPHSSLSSSLPLSTSGSESLFSEKDEAVRHFFFYFIFIPCRTFDGSFLFPSLSHPIQVISLLLLLSSSSLTSLCSSFLHTLKVAPMKHPSAHLATSQMRSFSLVSALSPLHILTYLAISK